MQKNEINNEIINALPDNQRPESGKTGDLSQRQDRIQHYSRIPTNFDKFSFFDSDGAPTQKLTEVLKTLPLFEKESKEHLIDVLSSEGKLNHHSIESILQAAFFKPNETKFSFEVAADGTPPNDQQLEIFEELGFVQEVNVAPGQHYDVGVIFGGKLGAIISRANFLLLSGCDFKSVALLGGQRAIFPATESGDELKKVIGENYYKELEEAGKLPKTETDLMTAVWESCCRQNGALRDIQVINIDSQLRIGKIKEAPGTPETVVDLLNTLVSGYQVEGLESSPGSFLLSSSQPHGVRQARDFVSSLVALSYPGITNVDVIAYESEKAPSLKLYAQELAKLVHAEFLTRYPKI